ncbi:MAG TPA: VanZ family protein [Burkholderiales bacterium]|nr:VanZ family protein [Burkholderiales bacterium]
MRLFFVAFGWALVALIVWLSLTPSPPSLDLGIPQADKLGHFSFYGLAMFWFARLYLRTPVRAAYAAGFIAMGIALEFIQAHVGRDFEVADMAADAVGVALGWAAALFLKLRLPA